MIELLVLLKPLMPLLMGAASVLTFILGVKTVKWKAKKQEQTRIFQRLESEAKERERKYLREQEQERQELNDVLGDIPDAWDSVIDELLKKDRVRPGPSTRNVNGRKLQKPKK